MGRGRHFGPGDQAVCVRAAGAPGGAAPAGVDCVLGGAPGDAGTGDLGRSGGGRRGARARRARGGGGKAAENQAGGPVGVGPVAVSEVPACARRRANGQHRAACAVCIWSAGRPGAQCGAVGLRTPVRGKAGECPVRRRGGFQFPPGGAGGIAASGPGAPADAAARGRGRRLCHRHRASPAVLLPQAGGAPGHPHRRGPCRPARGGHGHGRRGAARHGYPGTPPGGVHLGHGAGRAALGPSGAPPASGGAQEGISLADGAGRAADGADATGLGPVASVAGGGRVVVLLDVGGRGVPPGAVGAHPRTSTRRTHCRWHRWPCHGGGARRP